MLVIYELLGQLEYYIETFHEFFKPHSILDKLSPAGHF